MLNQAFTKLEWDEIYVLNQAVGTKLDLNLEFVLLASPKLGIGYQLHARKITCLSLPVEIHVFTRLFYRS